jgi:drug/metabolite transporter (DMT)-like permease
LALTRYLALYILITAFGYVFAKDALGYSSPLVFGALNSLLTSITFFSLMRRFKVILNRDTLLFSLFYWIANAAWLLGLNLISPAQSAIVSFTMPFFAIMFAVRILGEKGTRIEAMGAVVGFSGVVLFNLPLLSGTGSALGIGLTLVDAFFWALFSVYMRKLRGQDPQQTLATASFITFLLYSAASVVDFRIAPSGNLAVDLVFIGVVVNAFSFYLWNSLLRVEKVGRLTTVVFFAPVITLVYTVAATRVIPSSVTLAGVALIFVGIYIANARRGEAAPQESSVEAPSPERGS